MNSYIIPDHIKKREVTPLPPGVLNLLKEAEVNFLTEDPLVEQLNMVADMINEINPEEIIDVILEEDEPMEEQLGVAADQVQDEVQEGGDAMDIDDAMLA